MIREDIPLYKLDLEGTSSFNKVTREYMFRRQVKNNSIAIPAKGPFYQKSMKLFDMAGKPLVEGEDYEFYGIMSKITQYTGKPVGLFIRLKKDSITEWYATYQVVGNFSKISNEILNMLKSIYEDDRFVYYENIENKPLWFIPEIHQHDLAYDIYAFTDLARELNRIAEIQGAMTSAQDFMVQTLKSNLDTYITGYKKVVMDLLNSHIGNKLDAHGTDKEAIGLGLVDNIPCATLEETLEGLRDDLTITPYNAFLTVKAAAGRNERLYPSGTLPILRYGSDTFIPPTIDGSFEGLGGLSRRCGMIVETDGTLLILSNRNNGKVRGLYFTRCSDWRSQQANYEFTAYRYTHPTATAAGATLDAIVNGSNRYIMVVGDTVKNLWWWCETHGTFDPSKHILIPLTGEWVSEDMTQSTPTAYYVRPWMQCGVVADKNYREHFAIVQSYTIQQYAVKDPTYLADVLPGIANLGALTNLCYSINVVSQRSSKIVKADLTYSNPNKGARISKYWFPWELELVDDPSQASGKAIKSCYAEYTPPASYIWMYRGVHTLWMKTDETDVFGLRLEQNGMVRSGDKKNAVSNYIAWRGKLKITRAGEATHIAITNSPENDVLYKIDITKTYDGALQWEQFRKNVVSVLVRNGCDNVGSAWLAPGIIGYSDGTGNINFPSRYAPFNLQYSENWQSLIKPPLEQPGGTWMYSSEVKDVIETNPVGLGTLFESQTMGIGDTDDYKMGGVFARQNVGKGYEWVFRPLNNLNANYAQIPPPVVGQYQGKVFNSYQFKPLAYKTNIGSQVLISSPLTIDGLNNKNMFKYVMGCTAETKLMGEVTLSSVDIPTGDDNWMQEVNIKLVDGKVTFTPVTVINLTSAVANDLAKLLAPAGLTATEVKKTWSLGRVLGADGGVYNIMQAWGVRGLDVLTVAIFVDITPVGTPDNSAGYAKYSSARIIQRSPYKSKQALANTVNSLVAYNDYNNGSDINPRCISIPYKGRNAGVMDKSGTFVAFSGGPSYNMFTGKHKQFLGIEANANCTAIIKLNWIPNSTWGQDSGATACPYYGIGDANSGLEVFSGAAVGTESWSEEGSIFDNLFASRYSGKRVVGMSNILTPQYTVYFQEMKNILLAGRMYSIPATHIDILDQDPNPANKKYYVYLYYTSSMAQYIITDAVRPESASQSLIATIYCGPTQIDQIVPYNRFSIDGASFSAVRQGSSILASSGSVYDTGDTSNILRDGDLIP